MQGSPQADITLKGSLEAPPSPEYMDEIPRDVDLQVDELLEADIGLRADVIGEACSNCLWILIVLNCQRMTKIRRNLNLVFFQNCHPSFFFCQNF